MWPCSMKGAILNKLYLLNWKNNKEWRRNISGASDGDHHEAYDNYEEATQFHGWDKGHYVYNNS